MAAPLDLQSLKFWSEGNSLDFKRDQYRLSAPAATVETKAEFIKDVLAMANSWATVERLLVVGVKAHANGQNEVVGITEHLDDADLQQLVNTKTNRPIEFHYSVHRLDGHDLGIVRIAPGQKRPFYLKAQFGDLKPNAVYVRRGSSTEVAWGDETAAMGHEAPTLAPAVSIELDAGDGATWLTLVRYTDPPPPPPIPPELKRMVMGFEAMRITVPAVPTYNPGPSPGALRDHRKECALLAEVAFVLTNKGTASLEDALVVARVRKQPGLRVLDEMPDTPRGMFDMASLRSFHLPSAPSTSVRDDGDDWLTIEAPVGKVRPKEVAVSPGFVLGSSIDTKLTLEVQVLDGNLAHGFRTTIDVPIEVHEAVLPLKEDEDEDEDDEP